MMKCGGFGDDKPADAKVEQLVQKHHEQIRQHLGHEPGSIKVLNYQTQVVAGTNYAIKVEIQGQVYVIKIYEKLPCDGEQTELTEFHKA